MSWEASNQDLTDILYGRIPGGTTNSVSPIAGAELVAERGEGPWLFDTHGQRYLDVVMGGGPLILGHAHPHIREAIRRAAAAGTHHFAVHRRALELAERLCDLVPCAEMIRFASSGSEATFHALRLARAVTGRQHFIKFDGAYHGHHDLGVWSFEHSDTKHPTPVAESAGIQAGVADTISVLPFNDSESIRDQMRGEPGRYAAVICEPYQRALAPDPEFLRTLRDECDRSGTVLIFDEVVTGFRFAPGGAQELYGVTPDLAAFGKALAGGVPLAAIAGRRELMQHLAKGSDQTHYSYHCGTFNGNLLGVEAAHATLDILVDEGGLGQLQEANQWLTQGLEQVCDAAPTEVNFVSIGGVFQLYFTRQPPRSAADVRDQNQAVNSAFHHALRANAVYKLPAKGYLSLAHDFDVVKDLVERIGDALRAD